MATSVWRLFVRAVCPAFVVSLYYFLKFGAKISTRSEVELTSNLRLGKRAVVGAFTKIKAARGPLQMGDRCGIATGCFISSGRGGIVIGDNFVCGPNVVIVANNYVFDDMDKHLDDQGRNSKGVKIGRNVWIGANSVVLDGTQLGDNCIVVANSLLNRRYPAGAVLQGNPAKILMKRTRAEQGKAGS
jgi:acetyltransferase-like isoleucine patch superfamily enzyme